MTGPRRASRQRRWSLFEFVLAGMLVLALVFFTMPGGASHMDPVTPHLSGTHHASVDAGTESHEATAWCKAACAVTVVPLVERGPEVVRSRGVPPGIAAGIEEHIPDDPLPPPRLAVGS